MTYDPAAVKARHARLEGPNYEKPCSAKDCSADFPCDAYRGAEEVERLRAELEEVRRQRDSANNRAKESAVALREMRKAAMRGTTADHGTFLRMVSGALKTTVRAHGHTVVDSWIGSATKRVTRQLWPEFVKAHLVRWDAERRAAELLATLEKESIDWVGAGFDEEQWREIEAGRD